MHHLPERSCSLTHGPAPPEEARARAAWCLGAWDVRAHEEARRSRFGAPFLAHEDRAGSLILAVLAMAVSS